MTKKSMLKLVSIRPHKYATRHMTAGEQYEAPVEEAIAQVALRNANFAKKEKPSKAQIKPAISEQGQTDPAISEQGQSDIDSLRSQASALGIDVDGRWGRARLQAEIKEAEC